jgi:hypothetical protein
VAWLALAEQGLTGGSVGSEEFTIPKIHVVQP